MYCGGDFLLKGHEALEKGWGGGSVHRIVQALWRKVGGAAGSVHRIVQRFCSVRAWV